MHSTAVLIWLEDDKLISQHQANIVPAVLILLEDANLTSQHDANRVRTGLVKALVRSGGDGGGEHKVPADARHMQEGSIVHPEAVMGALPVVW
jgi:hypothetical protein